MGRLDPEACMTIKALAARGTTRSEIARLLGVTEGAVRHHLRRMAAGVADGRSLQPLRAESQAAAIEHAAVTGKYAAAVLEAHRAFQHALGEIANN